MAAASTAFIKGGIIVKKKLVAAVLLVLVMLSTSFALAASNTGGWSYWVDYPDGTSEFVDPADFANGGWGNGELGDESIPLYALCGLAAIAAVGAVVMHKKRQRVG